MSSNIEIVTAGLPDFLEQNVKELTDTKMGWAKDRTMKLIESLDELSEFVDRAIETQVTLPFYDSPVPICVVDLETTGLNTRSKKGKPTDKIVGFCLSFDSSYGVYVPIGHIEGEEHNLPEDAVVSEIKRLCANCVTIYHNAKFDLQMLRNYGIIVDRHDMFEDTLILARLFDAGQKDNGLKSLSNRHLNQEMLEFKEVTNTTNRFDMVSPRVCIPYACADAMCTMDLFHFFMRQEIIVEQKFIYNLEKRTVFVVLQMERNLIRVDVEYLKKVGVEIKEQIELIKKEVFELAGMEFNIGSAVQLGEILFEKMGYRYPDKRKTASGQYMTDTATLEKISDDYPIVKKIVKYRGLEKSLGTYITNLLKNCDEEGCIKLSFNQSGTDTGRFSSPGGKGLNVDGYCGVNIQSIPSNYEEGVPDIRKALVARPGFKIVAMDYSGEELRIATNLSREPKWLDAFVNGDGDLHSATGRIIYNRQEITKAERQTAKTCNFLTMYGGGHKGLAVQAKISENEARKILTQFFAGLPKLKKWIDLEHAKARKQKKVRTALGRVRPLEIFYDSDDRISQARGDRCAVNTKIQGAGADIMKVALVKVHNWIRSNDLEDEIKLLITMHDEIVFEMPEDKLHIYIPILNKIMKLEDVLQKKLNWPVALSIDAEYGDSWHVDHDFFEEHPYLESAVTDTDFQKAKEAILKVWKGESQDPKDEPRETEAITESVDQPQPSNEEETPHADEKTPVEEDPAPSPELNTEEVSESGVEVIDMDSDNGVAAPKLVNENKLVYTLRDTRKSTVRLLNDILEHIREEDQRGRYVGPKRILILRDRSGHSLLVDDIKVSVDAFLALARYRGL